MQRFENVDLAKITVECKTCGLTESFYSDLSVQAFKLRHKGHQVEGGERNPGTPARAAAKPAPAAEPRAEPAEDDFGTKLTRVLVDIAEVPDFAEPAFRVRGYVDGIDEAFMVAYPADEAAKVREVLAGGRYVRDEPRKAVFSWEAYAVDYEEGVRERLETVATPTEAAAPAEVVVEELQLEVPRPEPVALSPAPERIVEVVKEEPEEDYLLVSKSWYVQGGAQNRREAARISKVLRAFRWRVEPMYTLGVMLDDIVSIESARNEIGRELVQSMESAGYRLTVIAADNGKLVAWFKKTGPGAQPLDEGVGPEPPAAPEPTDEKGTSGGDDAAGFTAQVPDQLGPQPAL